MDLPLDVKSLRAAIAAGLQVKLRLFWRIDRDDGDPGDRVFSQWYEAPFTAGGETFRTAEHYMMAAKARLMGDEITRGRILKETHPKQVKALGRAVQGFDEARWVAHRFDLVTAGNIAKFTDEPRRSYLLGTGDDVLVEASPLDPIWGIGLAPDDARAHDPAAWRGLNLLGFALMKARAVLRQAG